MVDSEFIKLSKDDGSWAVFEEDWANQCETHGETLETFSAIALKELAGLAGEDTKKAGVYGLRISGRYMAACQLNWVRALPGYTDPVLRMRFMTLCPDLDFGTYDVAHYANVLIELLSATIELSSTPPMKARHIKFHLRSPADRQFFAMLGATLNRVHTFETVKMVGTWLYLSKR